MYILSERNNFISDRVDFDNGIDTNAENWMASVTYAETKMTFGIQQQPRDKKVCRLLAFKLFSQNISNSKAKSIIV